MNALPPPTPPAALTADDVIYAVFRQKWKIIACGILGLLAAGAKYKFRPPPFESDAKLFVRYVLEKGNLGPQGDDSRAVAVAQDGDEIINAEMEILDSADVAGAAVDAVGVDQVLSAAKGAKDRDRAVGVVLNGLHVQREPNSAVINLVFQDKNAALVQPILSAVIAAYLKKHVEVHHAAGAVSDQVIQETDQLRTELQQTEQQLRQALDSAGIVSVDGAKAAFANQETQIQQQIFDAQAELAERSAALEVLRKDFAPAPQPTAAKSPSIPRDAVSSYVDNLNSLNLAKKTEAQLLQEFTAENQRVKAIRTEITAFDTKRQKLEQQYPGIAAIGQAAVAAAAPASAVSVQQIDQDAAQLAGLQSKIKVLTAQLADVRQQEQKVDQLSGTVSELERQKTLQEQNYQYFATHLEASRIDEALSSGRAPNIAEIQSPTPPYMDWTKTMKIVYMLGAGGWLLGIGWALLIEMVLDRSIRRPKDLERGIRIPLFLSIPDFGRNGHNRHVFHETLRDRLIAYFESKGLTHKPKLVAVTGVTAKSGVTTTAAGLARSLSETAEGNVLLVDMTVSQGSAKQFYGGKEVCGLQELLEVRDTAQVQENLYVVGAEPKNERLSGALPTRFKGLVPQLKASDFDYVIFDMPHVNQISITPRLAGFMDMVLMVVESEHTDRDIAQEAASLLGASRAHVGVVLNKTRNYLPTKRYQQFLGIS